MNDNSCLSALEFEHLFNSRVPQLYKGGKAEGPFARGAQSIIYKVTCPGAPRPLFVKHAHDFNARSQYDAFAFARARLQNYSGYSVPFALPHLIQDGFVILEWFSGPTIEVLLETPTLSVSNIVPLLKETGRWLCAFHGNDERDGEYLDVDGMLSDIDRIGRKFQKYLQKLKYLSPLVRNIPIQTSYSHGDFKPANLIIEEKEVIAIDMGRVFTAPTFYDVSHFLLHLELHLRHPICWRLLPWRRTLRAAFLRGYHADLKFADMVVLDWLGLQRTLLSYIENVEETDQSKIKKRIGKIVYRRVAERYYRNLERYRNVPHAL